MPIIPAKNYKHPWVQRAHHEIAQWRKDPDWGMRKMKHVSRCPGIFNLQRSGWILRTWMDLVVETDGEGMIKWSTPLDQTDLGYKYNPPYVDFHVESQFAKFMENWREDTSKTILKLASPWRAKVPKGYKLWEINIPYYDEIRWTVCPGVLAHDQGYGQMNPQLMWHVPKGKTLIKAGTPISQYILVPDEQYEMEMIPAEKQTVEQFANLFNESRFVKNYAEIKRFCRTTDY